MAFRHGYVAVPESAFLAMKRLEDHDAVSLMDMIYHYASDGDEPSGDGAAAAAFEALRPLIDGPLGDMRGGE